MTPAFLVRGTKNILSTVHFPMTYQLNRLQYNKIYRINERTVRRWQEKNMPLDDPAKLLQTLGEQKNKPASLVGASAGDLYAHWLAESDPEAMRLDVQRELGCRIAEATELLCQARNLARARWKEWPEVAARINAIREHTEALLALLGIGDGYDWDEIWRPEHLAAKGSSTGGEPTPSAPRRKANGWNG